MKLLIKNILLHFNYNNKTLKIYFPFFDLIPLLFYQNEILCKTEYPKTFFLYNIKKY